LGLLSARANKDECEAFFIGDDMKNLISSNERTMGSREIAELTGKNHADVMRDIRNMLEKLEVSQSKFASTYQDAQNKTRECFNLDRYHTEILVTGYDVKRRAAVIKRWYDLETSQALPAVKDPQLAAMVTMLTQLDAVKQEQQSQRLELDNIKAKLQSTPDEFYTVAGYASLRGLSIDTKTANMLGRKCAKLSREYGFEVGKAHSAIYGAVNTYHVDMLCEVFAK
jgi:phage regulator Rha-like protein